MKTEKKRVNIPSALWSAASTRPVDSATDLLGPRCGNTNAAPLSEPKIFDIKKKGCGNGSPAMPTCD